MLLDQALADSRLPEGPTNVEALEAWLIRQRLALLADGR